MPQNDEDITYLANKAQTPEDYKRLQLLVDAKVVYMETSARQE